MNVALPRSLDVDQFLAWVVRQEEGRYELIDGVVIMQQSQQWVHAKVKAALFVALSRAVAHARVPFFVAPDGPTVRIGKRRGFVPDASVSPLPEPLLDSLELPNPVIVAEVLSPSTAQVDATVKLRGYFELPSIQHYLIVDPNGRTIVHHRRGARDALETRVVSEGDLMLDPPGITLALGDVFPPEGHSET